MPEIKTYIGCKIIQAYPDQKDGQDGYHVIYPDGYESWSPRAVFESAYREITNGEKVLVFGPPESEQGGRA